MHYVLKYHPDVKETDIPRIDVRIRTTIKKAIEERLRLQPEKYGKPLRRSLKGYWKLRVSDYRTVFKIIDHEIHILVIMHRKNVYTAIQKKVVSKK